MLKSDWNAFPHPDQNQKSGDRFVEEGKACILKVPSMVVPGDFKYLLKPPHADFKKAKIIDQ